jgi:hypothetical protein
VANDYIADLLPKMIDDLLEITIDPLIPPNFKPREDRSNGFELIYCESGSTLSSKPINIRSSFFSDLYPIKELEQPVKKHKPNVLLLLSKGSIRVPEFEENKIDENSKTNNTTNGNGLDIEQTYKTLKNYLNYKTSMTLIDLEWIGLQVLQILNFILSSPKKISDKQVNLCCKIMLLISTSPANAIFVEVSVIAVMSMIMTSREVNFDFSTTLVRLAPLVLINSMTRLILRTILLEI